MPVPFQLIFTDRSATGFVVSNERATWLVTCLHFAAGNVVNIPVTHTFPKDQFIFVPELDVRVPVQFQDNRRVKIANDGRGAYFDALSIRLTDAEVERLSPFGFFDINTVPVAEIGDEAHMIGFPGPGDIGRTLVDRTCRVEEVFGVSIKLDVSSSEGFSGGPLVTANGVVGVLYGSVGLPPRYDNALANSLQVLSPVLFAT